MAIDYDGLFKTYYGRDPTPLDKVKVFDKLLNQEANQKTSGLFNMTDFTLTELLESLQAVEEGLTQERIEAAIRSLPYAAKKGRGF